MFGTGSLLRSRASGITVGAVSLLTFLFTGCGIGNLASPSDTTIKSVTGTLHGGQTVIQGASVVLYHTDPTATTYGAPGIVVGSSTTDANGSFTILPSADSTTCPASSMAYITAAGGYQAGTSSASANANMLQMIALGPCSNINANTSVVISEVTTVAAAYALNSFMTTSYSTTTGLYAANVSAPSANSASNTQITPTKAAGLLHAFYNAQLIANPSDGRPTQTASITVNGASVPAQIPYAQIATLADILQACVDSTSSNGNLSSTCGQLFTQTPSISGAVPGNTLQAMMNLARNPYPSTAAMNATTGLLGLAKGVAGAYQPQLTAPPYDWAIAIVWRGTTTAPTTTTPAGTTPAAYWLGVDANDTVYYGPTTLIATNEGPGLYPFNPYGITTPTFGPAGTSTTIRSIAADQLGNVWAVNNGSSSAPQLFQYINGGTPVGYTSAVGSATGLAIDASNNVWVGHAATAASSTFNVDEFAYSLATKAWAVNYLSLFPAGPYTLSIDASQNIWGGDYYIPTGGTAPQSDYTLAAMIPNTGTVLAPSYATSGTAATTLTPLTVAFGSSGYRPYNAVFDASGNAWYTIYGAGTAATSGLDEITPSSLLNATSLSAAPLVGSATVGSTAQANTLGTQQAEIAAIDGAGTIFIADNNSNGIHAYTTAAKSGSTALPSQVLSESTGFRGCGLATISTATCSTTASTGAVYNPRQIIIDSTGSVWGGITSGGITQIIGLAAPVYPLPAAGLPGVMPGMTTAAPLP